MIPVRDASVYTTVLIDPFCTVDLPLEDKAVEITTISQGGTTTTSPVHTTVSRTSVAEVRTDSNGNHMSAGSPRINHR